jgi:hypothetical protein
MAGLRWGALGGKPRENGRALRRQFGIFAGPRADAAPAPPQTNFPATETLSRNPLGPFADYLPTIPSGETARRIDSSRAGLRVLRTVCPTP